MRFEEEGIGGEWDEEITPLQDVLRSVFRALLVLAISWLIHYGCDSQAASAGGTDVLLELTPASDLEMGCFDPCACPVRIHGPLKGTLRLVLTESSPTERRYDVQEVDWTAASGTGAALRITGSGSYHQVLVDRVALHRMTLDLTLAGTGPLIFDSGLDTIPPVPIPLGTTPLGFVLDVAVSRHGEFCHDTLFTIHAAERTADVPPPGPPLQLAAPWPNPFRDRVDLSFSLAAGGEVELAVFGASGRRVRTLIPASWRPAGPHAVGWDGTDEQGRAVAAGVLFVRLRTPAGTARTTLVRIR